VTAAIETAVAGSVTEAANIAAASSKSLYQDASVLHRHRQARFGQVAERSCPDPVNMVRAARGSARLAGKATTEYLGKLVADGARPRGQLLQGLQQDA